jgi:hypothetical protein
MGKCRSARSRARLAWQAIGTKPMDTIDRPRDADDIDVSTLYPEGGLPRGLSLTDLQEIEEIFFQWETGRDPRAILTAFKVYERLGALLHARGIVYQPNNTVSR